MNTLPTAPRRQPRGRYTGTPRQQYFKRLIAAILRRLHQRPRA